MSYKVRYTKGARDDLFRLYRFLATEDLATARNALAAIKKGVDLLQEFPFTCRKVITDNALLRELIIPFGSKGYVILFEIDNHQQVTLLAVRHQREEDYH